MAKRLLILVFLISLFQLNVFCQNWPQWRGPDRDGILEVFTQPSIWPSEMKLVWKTEVGLGHSSPITSDGKIYLFSRQGEDEVLTCIDKDTGKVIWKNGHPVPYKMNSAARTHGKGPKSTPLISDGRIYTLGISGILSCFDSKDGELLWRKEFSRYFKETSPLYGVAMSVAYNQGVLFAHIGGHKQGALIAFDVKTGETVWNLEGDGPGYASPIIADIDGSRTLVTQSREMIIGVDIGDGNLLWAFPFSTAWDQNSVTPVIREENLFFSGLDNGVWAVRILPGSSEPESIWKNEDVSMYMSSPVIIGHLMYGFSHKRKGQFFCLDTRSGEVLWTSEGRQGENAAIIGAGKTLFFLTNEAELWIVKANGQKYEVLANYSVADSPTWAHPVLLRNRILVKDESTLALWSLE